VLDRGSLVLSSGPKINVRCYHATGLP